MLDYMEKKGQLTAFVLVAFVILILIVVLTVIYVSLVNVSINDKQYVNKKTSELKEYIDDCIMKSLTEGLKKVGIEGIAEYMNSINCGDLGKIPGVKVDSQYPISIKTVVDDDKISLGIDYGVILTKGKVITKINPETRSYEIFNKLNVDANNDKRADNDINLNTISYVATLVMTKDTKIDNGDISIGLAKKSDANQLTDIIIINPENNFDPNAYLSISYLSCNAEDAIALVNKKTLETYPIECIAVGDEYYAVASIKSASEYFIGSCDDYGCPWLEPETEIPSGEDPEEPGPDDDTAIKNTGKDPRCNDQLFAQANSGIC